MGGRRRRKGHAVTDVCQSPGLEHTASFASASTVWMLGVLPMKYVSNSSSVLSTDPNAFSAHCSQTRTQTQSQTHHTQGCCFVRVPRHLRVPQTESEKKLGGKKQTSRRDASEVKGSCGSSHSVCPLRLMRRYSFCQRHLSNDFVLLASSSGVVKGAGVNSIEVPSPSSEL